MSTPKAKRGKKKGQPAHSQGNGSIMVGVLFDEGIVLAVNMKGNLIFYLDDHIYCCASASGFDRKCLMEVFTELKTRTSSSREITVAQTLDLICKLYERVAQTELLLAGTDSSGLHLIALKSMATTTKVNYASLGRGSSAAAAGEFLKCHWKPGLNVKEAEQLARKAIFSGSTQRTGIDLCIIFRRMPDSPKLQKENESSRGRKRGREKDRDKEEGEQETENRE